ncbi:multidrug effflux MFS transporter [Neiella sp. HB171785]|uniref:Bcr/CflA family efflux transporter n=2 Tax=Neiella litorisoli TaxID=2771431 RepID=A0A8J6QL98_9GAMM|nr:multidrug effflux MFS transporter [Neiella litorisoli]
MAAMITLLAMIVAMTPLAIDMYLPAMPTIATDFNTPLADVQRSLTTFLIGFAAGQLVHGPLSDGLGRRPVMLGGLALFVVASAAAAIATTVESFMIWRVVQAFGGAAGSVVINAIITDKFDGPAAIKVRSAILSVMLVAPLLAPSVGSFLLHLGDWHAIYWVLAVYGTVALAWSWRAFGDLAPGVGGTNLLALFRRYKVVLTEPKGWLWFIGMAFHASTMFAFIAGSPYLYMEYFGASPQLYGILFAANVVVMATCAFFNGRLAGRAQARVVLRRAQTVQLMALISLVALVASGLGQLLTIVPLMALAIGVNSFVFPNATQQVMELFRTNAGTASALLGASQFGMGALASGLVTLGNDHGPLPMVVLMATTCTLAFSLVGLACRQK